MTLASFGNAQGGNTETKTPSNVVGAAKAPMIVDWTYLRMNQPSVVVNFLQQAKVGKIPLSKLAGLGTPSEVSALVQAVPSPTVVTPQAGSNLGASNIIKPTLAAPLKLTTFFPVAPALTILPNVNVGSNSPQYALRGFYETTANHDGNVTVAIKSGTWNWIWVQTYTGTGLSGGSRRIDKSYQDSNGSVTFPVRAGQGFSIDFSDVNNHVPGDSPCTFTVTGGGLNLQGSFSGNYYTNLIRISPIASNLMLTNISGATAKFSVTNDSPRVKTVDLMQAGVPAGVTVNGTTLTMSPHETRQVLLAIQCSNAASIGANQMVTIQADAQADTYDARISATCPIWLNIFQPFAVYSDHGTAGKVDATFSITLSSNGLCHWNGSLHDNSTWVGDAFQLEFFLNTAVSGSDHIGMSVYSVLGAEHSGPSVDFRFDYTGTMADIANRWDQYVGSGFVWYLTVDGDLNSVTTSGDNWFRTKGVTLLKITN